MELDVAPIAVPGAGAQRRRPAQAPGLVDDDAGLNDARAPRRVIRRWVRDLAPAGAGSVSCLVGSHRCVGYTAIARLLRCGANLLVGAVIELGPTTSCHHVVITSIAEPIGSPVPAGVSMSSTEGQSEAGTEYRGPLGYAYAVADKAWCCCEYDHRARNLEFLDGLDPDYFSTMADLLGAELDGDHSLAVSVTLRMLYVQAIETLLALLGATVQAPEAVAAWITTCTTQDLDEVTRTDGRSSPNLDANAFRWSSCRDTCTGSRGRARVVMSRRPLDSAASGVGSAPSTSTTLCAQSTTRSNTGIE